MKKEEYVETLLINNKMINVGIDDAGQTYFLEYADGGKLVETCVGVYETDYVGYAEMLFETPINCEHYNNIIKCEILDKTYCSKCDKSILYQNRDKRLKK